MKAINQKLATVLANSYALYVKTHNFHWNVTGPHFNSLHTLFEEQYTDLAAAVDEIAERIRTLGDRAPGSFKEFSELSSIPESVGTAPAAMDMVSELVKDQETVCEALNTALSTAQEEGDEATADLLIQRIQVHSKNRWMLESHLG